MHAPKVPDTIRLDEKLALVERLWTPHRIARFDDHQLFLARLEGDFVWHRHEDHDEVFLPLSGTLFVDFEDGTTRRVGPGELLVIPAGLPHRPRTDGEPVAMLAIDPMDVRHTGEVESERTVHEFPEI